MSRNATQTSLIMVILCGAIFLLISTTTNARSMSKRYSSPHVQLSRQRRRLERLYNQLLVVYQVMNLEEDVERMTPVRVSASWPESVEMNKLMKVLYSGEGQVAHSSLKNRHAVSRSGLSLSHSPTSSFTRRLMQRKIPTTTNKMLEDSRKRSRILNTNIKLSGNRNNAALETAALKQKVKQLCQVLNKRIRNASLGIIVRSCKLH